MSDNQVIPEAAVEAAAGERFAQELYDEFYYQAPQDGTHDDTQGEK